MKSKSICLKCQHLVNSDVSENGLSISVERCECFPDGFFRKVNAGKSECAMLVSKAGVTIADSATVRYIKDVL